MGTKNLYAKNREYLDSPTLLLYQDHDIEISELDWIQDLIEDARDLDNNIEGDFDLDYLKFRIYSNEYSFVKTGLIAFKIKALKLYKNKAKSFRQFCQDHLHKTHWQVNNLIRAAKVVIDLIILGFKILPRNEAQCRALLANCQGELGFAWQHVLDEHQDEVHKITAASITACLNQDKEEPKKQTLVLSAQLYLAIWEKAKSQGMKVIEYLEELFCGKQNGDNFTQKLKIRKWEEEEIENQDYYAQKNWASDEITPTPT